MTLFIAFFGFLFGAVLGSLSKALADRSLTGKSFFGRSVCSICKHTLAWYDLFPILSFIFVKGRCRYCHKKLEIDYLLIEVVMGVLIGYLFWQSSSNFQRLDFTQGQSFELIFKIFFMTILVILFLTDLKKMLIPDKVVIPSIVIMVVALILITIYKIGYLYFYLSSSTIGKLLLPPHSEYFLRHALMIASPLGEAFLSALTIGGFFLGLIIITRGKGMGGGDVKLGVLMGLGLGFPNSFLATMLAFLLGAIFSIYLVFLGRKNFKSAIAFGPFLVLGSLIMLFWGSQILDWYLHLTIN